MDGEVQPLIEAKIKVFKENQMIELLPIIFRLYFNVFLVFYEGFSSGFNDIKPS